MPTLFEIVNDGTHFGSHTAFGKMTFFVVPFDLAQRDGIKITLVGLFEIERYLFNRC